MIKLLWPSRPRSCKPGSIRNGDAVAGWLYGIVPFSYANSLFGYWVNRQHMIAVQFILMAVAWTHACIGLYFWLRMKRFFRWAAPILLSIAVLLPPLAMLGAHQGAQEVIRRIRHGARKI